MEPTLAQWQVTHAPQPFFVFLSQWKMKMWLSGDPLITFSSTHYILGSYFKFHLNSICCDWKSRLWHNGRSSTKTFFLCSYLSERWWEAVRRSSNYFVLHSLYPWQLFQMPFKQHSLRLKEPPLAQWRVIYLDIFPVFLSQWRMMRGCQEILQLFCPPLTTFLAVISNTM
jgi:hypothetical protein